MQHLLLVALAHPLSLDAEEEVQIAATLPSCGKLWRATKEIHFA
jgi:hypothetical protein